jgi:hypothetical protein
MFTTPQCLADHAFQDLRKEITFVDPPLSVVDLFEMSRSARVAFLDRPAGIGLAAHSAWLAETGSSPPKAHQSLTQRSHPHQSVAQQRVVINRIDCLLATSAVDRVGVRSSAKYRLNAACRRSGTLALTDDDRPATI